MRRIKNFLTPKNLFLIAVIAVEALVFLSLAEKNQDVPPTVTVKVIAEAPAPEPLPIPEHVEEAVPEPSAVEQNFTPVPARPPEITAPSHPLWQQNALPFETEGDAPKIVIVLDDLGLDVKNTRRAMDLKGPLTLAFLPYADNLPSQTAYGKAHGHELMLHMPMQPMDGHKNPGPNALTVGLGREEIQERVRNALDRFEGGVGLNNHMGSRFTSDQQGMEAVMDVLKERGLLFLDSRTIGSSKGFEAAKAAGIPALGRDVFLDNTDSVEAVSAQLAVLERVARRHGHAIAIGHPHANTITALQAWLPTLSGKNLQLVPISTLVNSKKTEIESPEILPSEER